MFMCLCHIWSVNDSFHILNLQRELGAVFARDFASALYPGRRGAYKISCEQGSLIHPDIMEVHNIKMLFLSSVCIRLS